MLPDADTEKRPFNFEEFLYHYRFVVFFLLLGVLLVLLGVFLSKNKTNPSGGKVEVLQGTTEAQKIGPEIVVEIVGAVQKSGVYQLQNGSRIEDLIIAAGGFSGSADRVWIDKFINRAAKLSDGQKVYIPKVGEQLSGESAKNDGVYQNTSSVLGAEKTGLININTASLKELDTLPGIGPVYGQNIIEHRPYSNVEELLSKGVLKSSVYQKIKDSISAN